MYFFRFVLYFSYNTVVCVKRERELGRSEIKIDMPANIHG